MQKPKYKLLQLGLIAAGSLACLEAHAEGFFENLKQLPVDFGGFFSQGVFSTSDNNYMAETDGEFTDRFREAGLNVTFSPFNRTTVSAQAFVQELGPWVGSMNEPILDYAFVDYNWKDWMGFRLGRLKRPMGIYNTIRDIDVARTSIFLPQSIYDNRWRDFFGYIDGLSIYGFLFNGALEYEVYYGTLDMDLDSGLGSFVITRTGLSLESMELVGALYGGQFWWNTPIDGLRIGQAVTLFDEIQLKIPNVRYFDRNVDMWTTSVQWYVNKFTFEFEHHLRNIRNTNDPFGRPDDNAQSNAWYISGNYQWTDKTQVGLYYSEYYQDYVRERNNPLFYNKALVLSLRYDLNKHWTLKTEVQKIDGADLLYNQAGQNPLEAREDSWWVFAAKATFSF